MFSPFHYFIIIPLKHLFVSTSIHSMNVLYASIANRMVDTEHGVESLKHWELVDLLLLQEYQTEIKSLGLDLYSIYLDAHENRLTIPENIVFF